MTTSTALVWAAAGDLDASFDGDGVVSTTAFGDGVLMDCAVQADGKVIGAGREQSTGPSTYAWKVGRWNADGTLDTSYGSAGFQTFFGGNSLSDVRAATLDASGRAIAVGSFPVAITSRRSTTYEPRAAVARLTTAGALDGSFGSGGNVTFAVPGTSYPLLSSVVVQPDGKIVAAGTAVVSSKKGNVPDQRVAFIARLNADGTLDSGFGSAGITVYDVTAGDERVERGAIALQSTGRIVLATSQESVVVNNVSYSAGHVVRLDPSGAIDTSFGVVSSPSAPYDQFRALAVDASDRIVVVGHRSAGVNVAGLLAVRLAANGALDSTFGTGGVAVLDASGTAQVESLARVAIATDGRLVCGGYFGTQSGGGWSHEAVVARLDTDGALDATFGAGGVAAPLATGTAVNGLAIASDGRIVIGAWETLLGIRYGFLVRYLPN